MGRDDCYPHGVKRAFEPDQRFGSVAEAMEVLLKRFAAQSPEQLWLDHESGLLVPHEAPAYLFRGECGDFPTTKAAIHRSETYCLRDGRRLSNADLDVVEDLIPSLAQRFAGDYALDEQAAIGLIQHYGLPTWIVDFTYHLGCAVAFAAAGNGFVGRICVLPTPSSPRAQGLVNLAEHRWAERPRRQSAFGFIMPPNLSDLKEPAVRELLELKWFEFPLPNNEEDRFFLANKYGEFVRLMDDPSAGFLRHHITEYVEAHGKFSELLTEWLLERVPIVPRCHQIQAFEAREAVVQHLLPSVLGVSDFAEEIDWSRRYWSSEYTDSSWDRMKDWQWPPVGAVYADPRTFHGTIPPTDYQHV